MSDSNDTQSDTGPGASSQPPAAPAQSSAYPPYQPTPPQGAYPLPAYAAPYVPQSQVDRPRYGWIWAVVALVFVFGVIGSCAWAVSLIGGSPSTPPVGGELIAVIPVDGLIAGTGSAGVLTPKDFLESFDKATEDKNVKAIVLRVDSPGGTVAASEEISTYVKESKKPVVVTIGDVGASGAYMVSSQADKIFANPGSAVGSIGVITEIPNVSGLLDKLGVKFTTVHAGKYKGAGSPYRPLTPAETALIQGSVDEVYGQFIDIVAEGRNMPRSKVESLATGWAWNGEKAKELGLVDEIGTYKDALAAAAKLGGITGRYDVVTYDNKKFEDLLNSILGIRDRLDPLGALGSRGTTVPGPAIPR